MKSVPSIHERLSIYSQMEVQDICRQLGVTRDGLSEEQTEENAEKYGHNQIVGQRRDTVLYRLRRAFITPFSIALFLLAALSFFVDVADETDSLHNVSNIVIILGMLLVSGLVRFTQEMTSRQVAGELDQMVQTTVLVKREGRWSGCPSDELVVGDIVRLDAGDRVPADIRLLKTQDFFVSQGNITGESGILEKTPEPLSGPPTWLGDYKNTIFLGSTVTGGICTGIVLAVGHDTLYGGLSPEMSTRRKGFDNGEKSIAWVMIRFMLLLVPMIFVACGLTKGNWLGSFLFALSVSVGLMPELLPMVITACLSRGSLAMSRKQTVVRDINAMQGLGSMDVLCVDKTGTLTGDTVMLEYYMDVLGNESLSTLEAGFLNSCYHTGIRNLLDTAILKVRNMPGMEDHFIRLTEKNRKLDELPFDYDRKVASVLVQEGESRRILVKGGVEDVAVRCRYVEYRGETCEIGEDGLASVHAVVDEMYEAGMKVLAVAEKKMERDVLRPEDEYDLTLMGYLAFFDTPRKGAEESLKRLRELNIGIKVLTGDHRDVAVSVCSRLGIPSDEVLTGREFEKLSEAERPKQVEKTNIFAELSPRDKTHIVEDLQKNGHTVGFLGDGMNDLPATMQADVGISVDSAMDALKESADVILLKKDLNVLDEGVAEGRKAFSNMSKYSRITAANNLGTILGLFLASLFLPFYPLTAVQVLLLSLLYDLVCLVLPWDRVDPGEVEEPQEWSGRTLGNFMLCFGPVSTIFDVTTFLFLYFFLCPSVTGGTYAALAAAGQAEFVTLFQTGWFLESIWTHVLVLFLLRTEKNSLLESRPSVPVAAVMVIGLFLVTVLPVTPLGSLCGLAPLPAEYFLFLILTLFLYLALTSQVKKRYMKRNADLT